MNIGIFFIGVDKYIELFENFKKSFNQYFLPQHNKTYFVITDSEEFVCDEGDHKLLVEDEGWRKCNMHRYKYFLQCDTTGIDYLYFFNGNSICLETVNDEDIIPGEEHEYMCGLWHWFPTIMMPFDFNPKSSCHMPFKDMHYSFRGGMHGGRRAEFLEMCQICSDMIDANGKYIPLWNDEAYFNKYAENRNIMKVTHHIYSYVEYTKPKIRPLSKRKLWGADYVIERKKLNAKFAQSKTGAMLN